MLQQINGAIVEDVSEHDDTGDKINGGLLPECAHTNNAEIGYNRQKNGVGKSDENVNEAVKIATKTLLDFEREREEIKRRAGNVIVSGLPPKTNVKDVDLFGDFCGSNLTVKPRVVKVRRLGKDNKSSDAKLCVTLESAEAVNDVILSSRLLRASQDPEVRRVFMNRDLTRLQSEEAYTRRMAKRSSGARKEDTGQPFL